MDTNFSTALHNFETYFNLLEQNAEFAESIQKDPALIAQYINKQSPNKQSPTAKLKKISYSKKETQYLRYTMPLCHFLGKNIWLLKPTFLNRGRGIHVFKTIEELKTLLYECV